jgi:metallo-beta-lactamase family protein
LLEVILTDSARIQADEANQARILNAAGETNDLYDSYHYDAAQTIRQCVAVEYDHSTAVTDDIQVRLVDAGHILGSAMVHLTMTQGGHDYTITFTGDLGRRGLPFLRNPASVPPADLLVCESTYGGRTHQTLEEMSEAFRTVSHETHARGGKVLIPAFSLGRTQVVVHYVRRWMAAGLLPSVPIYVDSPLADDIAQIYRDYPECLDSASFEEHGDPDFLDGPVIHYVRTPAQSQQLAMERNPCIIVASGGMCDGGRIVRHLKQNLDDPRCSLVLVSYQAAHSLGRQLLDKGPTVRFHGRNWNKWLEVVELNGFSGHADQNDFLAYLAPLAGKIGRTRLVHGDLAAGEALAKGLRSVGLSDVSVPLPGETVSL